MKKKATARSAKATSRESTLNFPTSSEADLVAESAADETSTKSGAKNRRKRTADDADKHNKTHCDSSAHPVVENSSTDLDHELAQLPKGWRWVTLREIADISGGITKGQKYRETDILRRVPYLRVANVQRGYLDLTEMKEIDATETKIAALQLQPGDILFNEGGDRDKLGRGWIWNNELPVCIHQNHVFRARLRNTEHSPRFVSYYSNSAGQQYFYDQGKHTTNLASINLTKLGELPIPLPPPAEQHRIVAEIEKQFTRLDAGVAALKRVQANFKRYRAAVLKAACEGKLVLTEAELARQEGRTYETGEQLLNRIRAHRRLVFEQEKARDAKKKYTEPSEIEPGPLPTFPEGWTLASAEAVCSSVRDGTHDTPSYVQEGVPLITSKNLLSNGLDFKNVKLISREAHIEIGKRSGVERGDMLFAMIGTIGNPVVVETDAEFSIKNVGLFKSNAEFILPRYLRYWFMNPKFTRWLEPKQKGTTQKFVPLGLLRALVVALPPLAEQARIVAEVERRLSVVEELESIVVNNLTRTTRLRQSILRKAFAGTLLRPCNRTVE